ncbi:SOS response-associated peptidase [Candidatus Roizmanbacteria bacterium]|nr:MAG: SOS response-associated peptidase [Candidatus Roizmanbacteria bacterium]
MCGRFQIDTNKEEIEKHYGMELGSAFKSRYNAAPSQEIPVVTDDKIEFKKWDLPLKFGDKFIRNLANIRDDSLRKGWAKRFLGQRCLVPSTGYYEWKTTADGKVPYYFGLKKHRLFSFAGLYDGDTFALITTTASKQTSSVHKRMPVILSESDEKLWVNADNDFEQVKSLVSPFEGELEIYPISTKINNARLDVSDVVERVS